MQKGDLPAAERIARDILKDSPQNIEALETLALILLNQQRKEEALVMLYEVVAHLPESVNGHLNLGNALVSVNRYEDALNEFTTATTLGPDNAAAHVNRGVVLGLLDRHEAALESYERALEINPTQADALNNSGTILGNGKRHQEAIDRYERSLKAKPDFAEAHNNLAVSLVAVGRSDEALRQYQRAIDIKPGYTEAIKNRAELLALLGRNQEALDAYDHVMALLPPMAEVLNNRSTVLNALNRHHEALSGYDEALRLKPDYVDALNNRGITLAALNRFDEALQCFRTAIQLQPDYVNAHWNESLSQLRLGRFKEGWEKHEWRWKKPEFQQHKHEFPQPRWLGKEDVSGKTVLVTSEQGFGDAIHFSRYAPLLEARGAKVLLFVPEALVVLFQSSFPNAQVFSKTQAFPHFDYHCPILSLPLAFGTTLETVPANMPYLRAPGDLIITWRNRVGADNGKTLRAGIVWAGSASHKNDINRSIGLDALSGILATPNVQFFSLQKEISAVDEQLLKQRPQVTLLGAELKTFADTAAAIEALDIVISVDTSVAHLAAALGKPTCILLPYVSDWRWLPGRDDSPWYPSARLYWQQEIGQWAPTLQRVADDLARFKPLDSAPQPVPLSMDAALKTAHELHRAGNLADAEAICNGILSLQPQHFDALQFMGMLHLQQQRIGDGIACLQKGLQISPDNVMAMSNLTGALRLANRHDEAYPLYDRAAALAPNNPSIPNNRAVSLLAQKRIHEALASLETALAIDSKYLAALNNLGVAHNELRHHQEALQSFDAALAVKPDYEDAINNRGLALIGLGRLDEAELSYRQAISTNPASKSFYNNRGMALAGLNRVTEAVACFRKAQSLDASYVDAFWNESLMNLAIGNFKDGWQQYEWRWKKPEFKDHLKDFPIPPWVGKEPIQGRSVFLHMEQGAGDTIQFARYIDLLHAAGAKVFMSTMPHLRHLLETSFPQVGFCGLGDVTPPFHVYCALLTLPLAFGTTLETIPNRSPYLRAPDDRLPLWQKRIPPNSKLKVGIVWAGNPNHQNDRNRSAPLAALGKLLQQDGCVFYALQKEVSSDDKALLDEYGVTVVSEHLHDFSDTAAAIMQLDLVISVDTSVAHLAGALGRPVWLMLPFAPDWRWLLDREDSPWYPTARLFRQPAHGDIQGQVSHLVEALSELVKTH